MRVLILGGFRSPHALIRDSGPPFNKNGFLVCARTA
jgi:hypothetical protein